jgi:hypothetical protein
MSLLYRHPLGHWHKVLVVLSFLSLGVFATSAVRALRLSPLPEPPPPAGQPLPVVTWDGEGAPLWDAVRVVERDPFHPERRPPLERFLLPDDQGDLPPGTTRDFGPREVRLVGTAVSGESGGFVMCQVGNEPPRIVRIGEEVGGLTLQAVFRGEAEFTRSDGTVVTLSVPGRETDPGGRGN